MEEKEKIEILKKSWNGMSKETIENVLLFFHGSEKALILENGSSSQAYSISGKNKAGEKIGKIASLKKNKIKNIYLFSCNTGFVGKKGKGTNKNVAKEFLKRTKNSDAIVYAMDGRLAYGNVLTGITGNYKARLANDQTYFEKST